MRMAKSGNSQRKKAPPGRYFVRPPHREVMLVTRTPRVILAPDLGFEMLSIQIPRSRITNFAALRTLMPYRS
jgi:hypothetical protein